MDSSLAETDYSYTNSGDSDIMVSATGDAFMTYLEDDKQGTIEFIDVAMDDYGVIQGVRPLFSLDSCWRRCIIGDYGKTKTHW